MLRVIVTFSPSILKVFFCRFGLNTFFVLRKEKLTLFPYCLPFPVNSHFDAIGFFPVINNLYLIYYTYSRMFVKNRSKLFDILMLWDLILGI